MDAARAGQGPRVRRWKWSGAQARGRACRGRGTPWHGGPGGDLQDRRVPGQRSTRHRSGVWAQQSSEAACGTSERRRSCTQQAEVLLRRCLWQRKRSRAEPRGWSGRPASTSSSLSLASATLSRRSNHGSVSSSTRRQHEDDAAVLEAADVAADAARGRA